MKEKLFSWRWENEEEKEDEEKEESHFGEMRQKTDKNKGNAAQMSQTKESAGTCRLRTPYLEVSRSKNYRA